MIFPSDQIRVPQPDGTYRDYAVLALLGAQYGQLESVQGLGMPPITIMEQRGPLQHGATALDYRYGSRVLQLVISRRLTDVARLEDRRFELVDLLRPGRSFGPGAAPVPLVYRRWTSGGMAVRGTDLVTTAGSPWVQSLTGRFVHYGLQPGAQLHIVNGADAGVHTVAEVVHDGRLRLTAPLTADAPAVHFWYRSAPTYRDLYCFLELGPQWDLSRDTQVRGYTEVLRFVASDPFWYGPEQRQRWEVGGNLEHLRFTEAIGADDCGWFGTGAVAGDGFWYFADTYVIGGAAPVLIPYWGHQRAELQLELRGPMHDFVLSNPDTGSSLSFNYDVGRGRTITIDLHNLTAVDDLGNDLFMYLLGDFGGFFLSPDAANDRVNRLVATFNGEAPSSLVTLTWRNRYESI